jgi:hypothetical protein
MKLVTYGHSNCALSSSSMHFGLYLGDKDAFQHAGALCCVTCEGSQQYITVTESCPRATTLSVCALIYLRTTWLNHGLLMKIRQRQREGDTLCYANPFSIVSCLILQHDILNFKFGVGWNSPLNTKLGLFYKPRMMDNDECGAIGDMRIFRRNRSTRRKPAPMPLCTPQISLGLTWARSWAASVGSRRLTTWAMVRPVS